MRNLFCPVVALCVLAVGGCCLNTVVLLPETTSNADFIGPDDVSGHYHDAGSQPDIGGSTDYDGHIVFTSLARTVVDDVLPDDLQLMANTEQPSLHPVALIFGDQTNLTWTLPGGFQMTFPGGYNELILFIPFVQKDGTGPMHNYVVRMYLDWLDGVTGGNWFFGYRKELATFTEAAINLGSATVDTLKIQRLGADRFQAGMTGIGAWLNDAQAKAALPNYAAMQEIFRMPMLGTKLAPTGEAYYVCSYFLFDWQDTSIRPAKVDHAYTGEFTSGMTSWLAAGGLTGQPEGTFAVDDLGWELTSAQKCVF